MLVGLGVVAPFSRRTLDIRDTGELTRIPMFTMAACGPIAEPLVEGQTTDPKNWNSEWRWSKRAGTAHHGTDSFVLQGTADR